MKGLSAICAVQRQIKGRTGRREYGELRSPALGASGEGLGQGRCVIAQRLWALALIRAFGCGSVHEWLGATQIRRLGKMEAVIRRHRPTHAADV